MNIELHHIIPESKGGPSTIDNCIPLCFNCHADVGHYNPTHPKGTKYGAAELAGHRDKWFGVMASFGALADANPDGPRILEGEIVVLKGFLWREAFPGPPNYTSLESDAVECYWMLSMSHPVRLIASCTENGKIYEIKASRLQLSLSHLQYSLNKDLVLSDAAATGRIWTPHSGHHHGDALFEVDELCGINPNYAFKRTAGRGRLVS